MKKYNIFIILCILSFFYCIQEADSAEEAASLSEILSNQSVLAMNYWNFNNDTFLVVVTSNITTIEGKNLTNNRLTIYKRHNTIFKKGFDYDASLDHFLGMFPFGDNSDSLMTVWMGGSAYHFNVFSVSNGNINISLESGSHNFPEIADIDNDGKEEILISEGSFLINHKTKKIIRYPEATNIYKKNGKVYKLIKTVPWKDRFKTKK